MARARGTFNFSASLEVKKQGALDSRLVVQTYAELVLASTWADDDNKIWLYDGMIVSVVADTTGKNGVYKLNNKDAYNEASSWERIDAAAAVQVAVEDSLTSSSATSALSANQGKVLDEKITAVSNKLTGVYSYKGSKEKFSELPTDVKVGDVWNVEEAYNNHPAGTNWAWTGSEWDALAGSIDLSGYYTSEQVDAAIKVEADRAKEEEERLAGLIGDNDTAIKANAEDIAQNASDIQTLAGRINDHDTAIAGKVDSVEGYQLISDEKLALIDTNASDIDTVEGEIANLKSVDTGIIGRIETLEGMISGGEIDGSSLLEVVGEHTTKIAALESDNTTNKADIVNLKSEDTAIKGRLDSIESLNTTQQGSIDSISGEIVTIKSSINTNSINLTNLTNTVSGHTTKIGALESAIDGLAIKSVSADEKVLSADASGVLSTSISLAYDDNSHKIQLKGIDNVVVSELDAAPFIKDGMIESVSYDDDSKKIHIAWNTDAGITATDINISNLVDVYTAAENGGISISNNAISVKVDSSSDVLSVNENGIKFTVTESLKTDLGINVINASIQDHEERIVDVEEALVWKEVE